MRIAVIGANGQLGVDVGEVATNEGAAVAYLTHGDVEVAALNSVRAALRRTAPDIVVNTAALHNVDQCEEEPERAFQVNAIGARNLAIAAREAKARLIHVSTDYVFDGGKQQPYAESDMPRPANVYGSTKLAGEGLALAEHDDCLIVRTSGLYGRSPCRAKGGLNFVQLMLKLGAERGEVRVVDDQLVTPTYSHALAVQIALLFEAPVCGVVHATSQGECSWYDFARRIFELAGVAVSVQRVSSSEFPTKSRRPAYSVLENARLREMGLDRMPSWEESLEEYLQVSVPS